MYIVILSLVVSGSNTHNNGNPAGDGQAGDAGEGTSGTYMVVRWSGNNIISLAALFSNVIDCFVTIKLISNIF